jgi:hypothetical protein
MTLTRALTLSLLAVLSACGGSKNSAAPPADLAGSTGGHCAPGATQGCNCLGGVEGKQVCDPTGTTFGTCMGCDTTPMPDGGFTPSDMNGSPCGVCDGCCQGSSCIHLADQTDPNGSCGKGLSVCNTCGTGQMCVAGTGACASATTGCSGCTGCCDNNTTCYVDQSNLCGPSCTPCGDGQACINGACSNQFQANYQVRIRVVSIQLTTTNASGGSWDAFGGNPDPQVCFSYPLDGNTNSIVQGCTNYCSDVFTCDLTGDDGIVTPRNLDGTPTTSPIEPTPFMVEAFENGTITVNSQDNDSPLSPDPAGTGPYKTSTYQSMYSTGMFGNTVNLVFELF